jgi:hypothetical protein
MAAPDALGLSYSGVNEIRSTPPAWEDWSMRISLSPKAIARPASALIVVVGLLVVAGCSDMNDTTQRTLSGGAIGATVGAVGTALTGGCIWCGAAIGGAAGAAGGYIYDQVEKSK